MRLFKNNLAMHYPNSLFLCSSANEDFSDADIGNLGKNLAAEVKNYIEEWCPKKLLEK